MVVPRGKAMSVTADEARRLPARSRVPASAPPSEVFSVSRETAAMLASASPRKPRVAMAARSSSRGDLARRVALEAELGVLPAHAVAVVADADAASCRRPASSTRISRPRVEGVLDELLDDGHGPLDDLAGGDLLGHLGREDRAILFMAADLPSRAASAAGARRSGPGRLRPWPGAGPAASTSMALPVRTSAPSRLGRMTIPSRTPAQEARPESQVLSAPTRPAGGRPAACATDAVDLGPAPPRPSPAAANKAKTWT